MKLHQKLRMLRESHCYTLKELSKLTDIQISRLSDFELNRKPIPYVNISTIAKAYKFKLEFLFKGVDHEG